MGTASSIQSNNRVGYLRPASSIDEESVVESSTHSIMSHVDLENVKRVTYSLQLGHQRNAYNGLSSEESISLTNFSQEEFPETIEDRPRKVSMITTLAAISEEDSAKADNIRRLSKIHDQNLAALIQVDLQKIVASTSTLSNALMVVDDLPFSVSISSASKEIPGFPLLYINKEFEHITGYRRNDVLNGSAKFLQCPETNPYHIALLSNALMNAQPIEIVILNRRKVGMDFYNLLSLKPVFDEHGNYVFVIGVQMDISDDTATERELQCMEEQLKLLPNLLIPQWNSKL